MKIPSSTSIPKFLEPPTAGHQLNSLNESLNKMDEKLATLETEIKEDLNTVIAENRENLEVLEKVEVPEEEEEDVKIEFIHVNSLVDELAGAKKFHSLIERIISKYCAKTVDEEKERKRAKSTIQQFASRMKSLEDENSLLKKEAKKLLEEGDRLQKKNEELDQLLQLAMSENESWDRINQEKGKLIDTMTVDNEVSFFSRIFCLSPSLF